MYSVTYNGQTYNLVWPIGYTITQHKILIQKFNPIIGHWI